MSVQDICKAQEFPTASHKSQFCQMEVLREPLAPSFHQANVLLLLIQTIL